MEPLDGNAIAGQLFEHFGVEMTTATGTCAHCGARTQIAELRVYTRAPSAVARCRSCGNVVFVLLGARAPAGIEMSGFQLDEPQDPRSDARV